MPALTQRRPLVSCRDWRLGVERLTAKRTGGLAKRNAGHCQSAETHGGLDLLEPKHDQPV
jgi:hypothetical protein